MRRLWIALALLLPFAAHAENVQFGPIPGCPFGSIVGTCLQGGTALTNIPSFALSSTAVMSQATVATGGLFTNRTWTGTFDTGQGDTNLLQLHDQIAPTAGNNVNGFAIVMLGEAGRRGIRSAFLTEYEVNAPSANSEISNFYVASTEKVIANSNDNGTGQTIETAGGSVWAENPVTALLSTATNYYSAIISEMDISINSPVLYKRGLEIVQSPGDNFQGSLDDAAFEFSNHTGTIGWATLVQFGSSGGFWPCNATACTLIGAQLTGGLPSNVNATNGIDWHLINFSGNAYNDGHVVISGAGAITGATLSAAEVTSGTFTFSRQAVSSTIYNTHSGSPFTFTVPAGAHQLSVDYWGAGGGGGNGVAGASCATTCGGGGGGGGGAHLHVGPIDVSTWTGTSCTVTIGTGGSGAGVAGGDTTLNCTAPFTSSQLVKAGGGGAGSSGASATASGGGGSGSRGITGNNASAGTGGAAGGFGSLAGGSGVGAGSATFSFEATGGGGSTSAGAAGASGQTLFAPTGGASGGGCSGAGTAVIGTNSGGNEQAGAIHGAPGANGSTATGGGASGTGGAGGDAQLTTVTGGAGGTGGWPGGGGGGGGSNCNGTGLGGTGGAGADGGAVFTISSANDNVNLQNVA